MDLMPLLKKILFLFLSFSFLLPNLTFAQTEDRENLNVTAVVPADPSDFTNDITQVTSGSDFPQNTEIEYKVDYASLLSTSVNIEVVAQWYSGTSADQQTTVDVVDYVNGSATDGYGGTSPVIDTVNKKITWTISSFPASGSDSVTFKLKTNSNYQGSQVITFDVKSRINGPGFSTSDQTVQTTYKYATSPTPTPTPTASNPTPGPTATPTPTTSPAGPTTTQIEIRTISDTSATVFVETSQLTSKIIKFGTNINSFTQITSAPSSFSSLITLGNLKPNTVYYFRVYTTNSSGTQNISDIYTFKTAASRQISIVDPDSFVATSNETILTLLGGTGEKVEIKNNFIVLPTDTVFQFKFALSNASNAKKVQAIIRSKNTLGINNLIQKVDASTDLVNMIEIEPGIFAGNLKSKPKAGLYEIYVKVTEKNGNISEQKISDLKIINKFQVISKKNNKPLEGSRILFYIYNEQTKKFQLIPSSALSLGNPVFTNKHGEVGTVLPQARYKAEVSRLGYHDQTVNFTIGPAENENFPLVKMESQRLSIFSIFRYYTRTANDILLFNTQAYALTLSESSRFFDLVAVIILTCLVSLSLFAFSRKNHVPLTSLTSYFFYLKDKKARNERYIHGVVYGEDDKPISQANVYLTNETDEEIISHTKTNKYGEFYFKKGADKYLLLVMKKDYKTTPLIKYEEKDHVKFKITLDKEGGIEEIKDNFNHIFGGIIGMLFELILLLSFIFELLFINSFGLIKTSPFLAISIFNLLLWTLHLRHSKMNNE